MPTETMHRPEIELPPPRPLRILVAGEMVLDRYLWGEVERISPEAPIPVLRVARREERPGNAAFVCANLAAFGVKAFPLSVIGCDLAGSSLAQMMTRLGAEVSTLVQDPSRPTIVKERMLGSVQSANRGTQQLLRVDYEDSRPLSRTTETELVAQLEAHLDKADGILVCDINKGLLTPSVIRAIVDGARRRKIPVVIDPRLTGDYSIYRGATALTPNRHEAEHATGIRLSTADAWEDASLKLLRELDLDACLVTLDRDGMFLAERNNATARIRTTPREVYDVTGAGDVVLAVFGLFLIMGLDPVAAAQFANLAAGLEVAKQGATVVSRDDLARALRDTRRGSTRKIVFFDELGAKLDPHRRAGQRICLAMDCFDPLDMGHLRALEFARAQADLLVVGLNSDGSVQRLRGEGGPTSLAADCARILAALEAVDYVVVFDDPRAEEIVRLVQPHVLVKSEDWRAETEIDGSECA